MNNKAIQTFASLDEAAEYLRRQAKCKRPILLYAYNGTGKTRLSMKFKDIAKTSGSADTLYYNAFTEDLFTWDNDTIHDSNRRLQMNKWSDFFSIKEKRSFKKKLEACVRNHIDLEYKIDFRSWDISFSRDGNSNVKISRGEERIFVWCFFLTICKLATQLNNEYKWVKYIYIDDPISSMDEGHIISVACGLSEIIKRASTTRFIISTHHTLFFNTVFNEIGSKEMSFFMRNNPVSSQYVFEFTGDTPFYFHITELREIDRAIKSGYVKRHHYISFRAIVEKVAHFFGYNKYSICFEGFPKKDQYVRLLNLSSHGRHSLFEFDEINPGMSNLFTEAYHAFISKYDFNIHPPESSQIVPSHP